MTDAVGAQNSAKMPDYKKYGTAGALVGGAVGAASQYAWARSWLEKPLTEDQFIKEQVDSFKSTYKEATEEMVEKLKTDLKDDNTYKRYLDQFEKSWGEFKKQIPSSVAKVAAGCAVAGALIGGAVYLVKKSKANKANQTQQQPPQVNTKA